MNLLISFIIPVYNRPEEIKELLESFSKQNSSQNYEIVIVEDGSSLDCEQVIKGFKEKLNISYFYKSNSGPGDSRNYGMQNASGNFFIILDSDVILGPNYVEYLYSTLQSKKIHCFGGPDAAHESFSTLQKAIDFSMTSFFTTGGIRGGKKQIQSYEPRSFNMGISKEVFIKTGGFSNIHPGEDPDLSIRIQKLGYKTLFLANAIVYHKRRISFKKFILQVYKFGLVRPILIKKHPSTRKISFFLPSFFVFFLLFSIALCFVKIYVPLLIIIAYLIFLSFLALIKLKSIKVAFYVSATTLIQFLGYGYGFMKSIFYIHLLKNNPRKQFPFLFYKGQNQF
jgi:GT2 family glycosyltransferase